MSGQSPPRSRRIVPGQVHNVQQRETSRSPSLRERPRQGAKSQATMPLGSSAAAAAQMYAHNNSTQPSLQSSPPIGSNGRRPSPPPNQNHRTLPTPPQQQLDPIQDRRSASPAPPLHPGVQTHYPRPMHNNNNGRGVLDKYQGEWGEYTEQLIQLERADMQPVPQVSQQHAVIPQPPPLPHMNSYPQTGASSFNREETVSPPKDPISERVRATERASPKDLDLAAARRRESQTTARESPKTRDRQGTVTSTSPSAGTFSLQNHSSHTPENRGSPYHAALTSQGDYASPYLSNMASMALESSSPPTLGTIGRRNTVPQQVANAVQQQASQTPPSAAMALAAAAAAAAAPAMSRTDWSLPLQEAEDDAHHQEHRSESPHDDDLTSDETYDDTNEVVGVGHPSSSINGRDDKPTRMGSKDDIDDHRYGDRERGHTSEEYDSHTPRSPNSALPEGMMENFPPPPSSAKMGGMGNMGGMGSGRPRPRSGATDQLGLRGLDALIEQNAPSTASTRDAPPPSSAQAQQSANDQVRQQQQQQQQLASHRKPVPDISDQMQQQAQQQLNQHNHLNQHVQHTQHIQHDQHSQQQSRQSQNQQNHQHQHHQQHQQSQPPSASSYRGYDPRDPRYNSRYYMMDELHNYPDDASAYFQHYLSSPRPDAPIPPTPHSQSAAPSPSPLITAAADYRNNRDLPPFSPIAPVGSPYPFPFDHVRRQAFISQSANNSNHGNNFNNGVGAKNGPTGVTQNIDQAMLLEQYARQWQIYAQNNNWGAMSDSTFSPAPTPFQGAFSPWAHLHTRRLFGRGPADAVSMQSSPSHEPVPLPMVPQNGGATRRANQATKPSKLRREASSSVSPSRKPPMRVESTQPRDTSPEPSSSGEETAGEDSYPTPQSNYVAPPSVGNGYQGYDERWAAAVVPVEADDDADWVDEDEEVDPEDLLDLEYHPNYTRTSEKRRRRWEIGWEGLTQAFQNLDRQTDTAMVLVASPPDSSKLHIVSSRSIRRTAVLSQSPAMQQLKASFRGMAQYRRQTRSRKMPIIDHILTSSMSGDGSDGGSSESREGDLRQALSTALNSLDMMRNMYEHREARWNDEMTRMHQEREKVEFFLKQLYGDRHQINGTNGVPVPPTP